MTADVRLNVYDLLDFNRVRSPRRLVRTLRPSSGAHAPACAVRPSPQHTACVGLGVFHSGVEVYGREYAYGGHEFRRARCHARAPAHAQTPRARPAPAAHAFPAPPRARAHARTNSTSGVFETPPRVVPGGARFRESIPVGTTTLSAAEVEELLKSMSREYLGNRYHLLYRNCNHFCEDLCARLTGRKPPTWVRRAAALARTHALAVGAHERTG